MQAVYSESLEGLAFRSSWADLKTALHGMYRIRRDKSDLDEFDITKDELTKLALQLMAKYAFTSDEPRDSLRFVDQLCSLIEVTLQEMPGKIKKKIGPDELRNTINELEKQAPGELDEASRLHEPIDFYLLLNDINRQSYLPQIESPLHFRLRRKPSTLNYLLYLWRQLDHEKERLGIISLYDQLAAELKSNFSYNKDPGDLATFIEKCTIKDPDLSLYEKLLFDPTKVTWARMGQVLLNDNPLICLPDKVILTTPELLYDSALFQYVSDLKENKNRLQTTRLPFSYIRRSPQEF